MVSIIHYEIYTDRGDGWKLEERYAAEQRQEAFNLAKEIEQDKIKVKIIKESFDVQDNSYQEAVEYVSNLSRKKSPSDAASTDFSGINIDALSTVPGTTTKIPGRPDILTAVGRLVLILVLCLVFANVLVTLLVPVIESFTPEEITKPLLFLIFFVIFLSMAIPLLVSKVPWHVFFQRRRRKQGRQQYREKNFYNRAQDIIRRYNLNDEYDAAIAPAYPEAPLEFKKYIIAFLSEVVSHVNARTSLKDSFSRLGIKLVIFGGCMELGRSRGLRITEANSLLYDAYNIIDGGKSSLEAFYEAKRTYKDNKVAIFLTGVGAYLMSQIMEERQLDGDILRLTLDKWENLNKSDLSDPEETPEESKTEAMVVMPCTVNIQNILKFFDEALPDLAEQKQQLKADVRNIVSNLVNKYGGRNVIEIDDITSVEFVKLNDGVKFAVEYLKDAATYQDELNNENLIFKTKVNIVETKAGDEANLSHLPEDLFEHTYDNEILTTEAVKTALEDSRYDFEFLGEKELSKSGTRLALYKLVYEK